MTHADASEKFRAGDLGGAIDAAVAAVKQGPTDTDARGFLSELLCFNGDVVRADKHLDLINDQDTSVATGVALFRQILRGEMARQEVFARGRPPEMLDDPPAHLSLSLKALAALREDAAGEAAELTDAAEAKRPAIDGVRDSVSFADWRDLDDLLSGVMEVITSTGKYYWVPLERIASLSLEAPTRARDLLWRKAEIVVRGGPEGVVYLPATYPGTAESGDDTLKLGRATTWIDPETGPIRGLGLRTFLFDEQDVPVMELQSLTTEPPNEGAAP